MQENPEQKPSNEKVTEENNNAPEVKIGKELVSVLQNVLNQTGWESSLFLKTIYKKLQQLLSEAEEVIGESEGENDAGISGAKNQKILKEGFVQIYVLLYQFEGSKMQNWLYAIKNLLGHTTTRSAYKNEKEVQEFIRSKKQTDRYGYAIVNLHQSNIYIVDPKPMDILNHELLTLKEGSITLDNIVGFVHGNKRYYDFQGDNLVYKGEREIIL